MNPRDTMSLSSVLLSFSILLLISSPATAFNVTKLFDRHPEFSAFNNYLTQTNLAAEINRRQTITVLAVDNTQIGALSGRTLDVVKKVLSLHVILDYYDAQKLLSLSGNTALLTTMFQQTGIAQNKQGFLNVTEQSNGDVYFGSAVKGAGLNAKLLKSVAAQPYNISVLQISGPIIAPGIDVNAPSPPPPPPAPLTPVASPKPARKVPAEAPAPAADAPEVAADAPEAVAEAPEADSPVSSPPAPVEDVADKAPAPSSSSGTRAVFSYGFGVLMGLVMVALMGFYL